MRVSPRAAEEIKRKKAAAAAAAAEEKQRRLQQRESDIRETVNKKNYTSAESLFIEASRVDEAVKMYKDADMLEEAIRVAKTHKNAPGIGSNVVNELLLGQARVVVNKKNYASAESLFIEASKVEEAVKMYKDTDKLDEAIRVAKTYKSAPHILFLLDVQERRHVGGSDPRRQDTQKRSGYWVERGE